MPLRGLDLNGASNAMASSRTRKTVAVALALLALFGGCLWSALMVVEQRSRARIRPVNVVSDLPFTEDEQRVYVQQGSLGLSRFYLKSRRLEVLIDSRWMFADMSDDERVIVLRDQRGNAAVTTDDGKTIQPLPKLASYWGKPVITRDGTRIAVPRSIDYNLPDDQQRPTAQSDIYIFDVAKLEGRKLPGEDNQVFREIDWSDDEQFLLAHILEYNAEDRLWAAGHIVRVADGHRFRDPERYFIGYHDGKEYPGFGGSKVRRVERAFMQHNCPGRRVRWEGTTAWIERYGTKESPVEFEHLGGNPNLQPFPELTEGCGYILYTTDSGLWMSRLADGASINLIKQRYFTTFGEKAIQVQHLPVARSAPDAGAEVDGGVGD